MKPVNGGAKPSARTFNLRQQMKETIGKNPNLQPLDVDECEIDCRRGVEHIVVVENAARRRIRVVLKTKKHIESIATLLCSQLLAFQLPIAL